MTEAPAGEAVGGLADRDDRAATGAPAQGRDDRRRVERAGTAEPTGPDRLLLALDRQQPAAEPRRELPHRLPGALPRRHQTDVGRLQVVIEDRAVDHLTGEQSLRAVPAALHRALRPDRRLTRVLDALGVEQPVEGGRVEGEQPSQLLRRGAGALRLPDQRVAEQGARRHTPTHDRVERDPRAGGEPHLGQNRRRRPGVAAIAELDHRHPVLEQSAERLGQAVAIDLVSGVLRVRDRVGAIDEARGQEGKPGPEAGRDLGGRGRARARPR